MINKAIIKDIDELEVLINSAYRGDEAKKGWTTEAGFIGGIRADKAHIQELIEKPNAQILKYVDESNKINGCVFIEAQEDGLYLGMLCVSPTLQNGGIGKKLLFKSEEIAKEHGLDKIKMVVISRRTELVNWYERHGYTIIQGEEKPFLPGKGMFGEPSIPLTFITLEKTI
jgi:ribosomal protein S18 acetylase RimI-like enzyme